MTEHMRQRPSQATGAPRETSSSGVPSVPSAAEDATSAHCVVCGHALHKPSSVAARLGPVCRGRLDAEPLGVSHDAPTL